MEQGVTTVRGGVRLDTCPGCPFPPAPAPQPLQRGTFLPPFLPPTPTTRMELSFQHQAALRSTWAGHGSAWHNPAPSVVALDTPGQKEMSCPGHRGMGPRGPQVSVGQGWGRNPRQEGPPGSRTTRCLEQKGPGEGSKCDARVAGREEGTWEGSSHIWGTCKRSVSSLLAGSGILFPLGHPSWMRPEGLPSLPHPPSPGPPGRDWGSKREAPCLLFAPLLCKAPWVPTRSLGAPWMSPVGTWRTGPLTGWGKG